MTSVPSQGEAFSKLLHHWDESANQVATLAHLTRAQANFGKDRAMADGWIAVGELMRRMRHQMVELAKGKLQ
jgi:hypothetical protein